MIHERSRGRNCFWKSRSYIKQGGVIDEFVFWIIHEYDREQRPMFTMASHRENA